jgi:uncharacterized membrane protein
MKSKTQVFSAAIGSLLCMGALGVASQAGAADAPATEKCYGVVKAGKNDCQAGAHACAGQAKADGQGKEWIALPPGVCERIVNGSLTPVKK